MAEEMPYIYFGSVTTELFDWRSVPDEPDPDDEELEVTPSDVIAILGFDPKELS
jgi:hypothetical protein